MLMPGLLSNAQGVSQVKTDSFAFAPLAYWEQPPVSGYGVKNFVSFNTPVETIGEAIAVAIANGAQIIQNVQFITSPNSGLDSLRPLLRRPHELTP
jgi:uncharacterized protein YggE